MEWAGGLQPGDALGSVEHNTLGVGADPVEGDAEGDVDAAQVRPPFREAHLEQESACNFEIYTCCGCERINKGVTVFPLNYLSCKISSKCYK